MRIHAITLIEDLPRKIDGIIEMGDLYRVGFCGEYSDAQKIVEEQFTGDKDWCYTAYNKYKYCIIESYNEGVPANLVQHTLFKWENGQFVKLYRCEEPAEIVKFSNYCMG